MKDLVRQVDEILLFAWDPIGVADERGVRDEYPADAPVIARKVKGGVDAAELADHLLRFERQEFGLPGDSARAALVAQKLTALVQGGRGQAELPETGRGAGQPLTYP